MNRGRLIVFEGPDGCGKTTLSKELVKHLQSIGEDVVWSSFPGRDSGTLGNLVYQLHHDPRQFGITKLAPVALQAMHIAAHLDAISERLRPTLESGQTIILDRYWWSTWVYGLVDGVNADALEELINAERAAWAEIRPFSAFLVRRNKPFRDEYPTKWDRLNRAYEEICFAEAKHHPVTTIWNEASVESAMARITHELASLTP